MWSEKNEENSIIQRIDRYIELLTEENQKTESILLKSRYQHPRKREQQFSNFYQDVYELTNELEKIKEDRYRLEKILQK